MDTHDTSNRSDGLNSSPHPDHSASSSLGLPPGSWLTRNGPYLVLFAVILGLLYHWLGLDGLKVAAIVAFGLGFVIFIHELGHFLVAKWCDVHVETFSIGFGPAIPGCRFQKGETTYMLAWFPLGGYVKMVGEGAENEEEDDDPRSFKNKTVWQRMAIISAGVTMNVILGCICFVIAFMHGVERHAGVIGTVDAASPTWEARSKSGMIIEQIGDIQHPTFDDLQYMVVLSKWGEELIFVTAWPGQTPQTHHLKPRLEKSDLKPVIGVAPSQSLELGKARLQKMRERPTNFTSPAYEADPPFLFGDTIIGTTDPAHPDFGTAKSDDPKLVTLLQLDPRPDPSDPASKQPDYFQFRERLHRLAGKEMIIQVRRAQGAEPVNIKVAPAFHYTQGTRMKMGKVAAVRPTAGMQNPTIQPGDRITQVELPEADGSSTRLVTTRGEKAPPAKVTEQLLDPLRLPMILEEWAARQQKAGSPAQVILTVLRPNPNNHKQDDPVTIKADWEYGWEVDNAVPLSPLSPMSLSGLGIAYRVENTIEDVAKGSVAEEAVRIDNGEKFPLQKGDIIKAVRFYDPSGKKKDEGAKPGKWMDFEESSKELKRPDLDQWAWVDWALQASDFKDLDVRVARGNETIEVTLKSRPDSSWPMDNRGFDYMSSDFRLLKADNFVQAVDMGVQESYRFIIKIYQQLQGMFTGRISYKLMGGPIRIATTAYQVADYDFYQFIFFLGLISVNLAVINFLPIPVLDGGHMVFLIYEKLRGKPASEQVRVAATYLGVILIFSLMCFVIYRDLKHLF